MECASKMPRKGGKSKISKAAAINIAKKAIMDFQL